MHSDDRQAAKLISSTILVLLGVMVILIVVANMIV